MYNCCAVIPSLNPDDRIFGIVQKLRERDFAHIIVVNDGSNSDERFIRLKDEFGCDVLTHCINFGKGRGMKTAMNYYMNEYSSECDGIIFIDGDGQHDINDVCSCCDSMEEHPGSLILGVRDFTSEGVPARSKFGNRITSRFFSLFCGLKISDTQTGLRAMSNAIIPKLVGISGERFEYETNMLLETKHLEIPIVEVPIRTIYEGKNEQSHFNPIRDSIAIYKVLLGYVSSSLLSAVIDLGAYQIFFLILAAAVSKYRILFSTILARILSSLFNYTVNCKVVFRSNANPKVTIVKYYLLCIIQAAASFGGVYGLSLLFKTDGNLWLKLITDSILFIISFKIQQLWVFAHHKNNDSEDI